jgi:hypothetical protein
MMKQECTSFDKILAIPKSGLGLDNVFIYTSAVLFQVLIMEPLQWKLHKPTMLMMLKILWHEVQYDIELLRHENSFECVLLKHKLVVLIIS